jgi:iron(III) transport system substrate-binding protein
MTMEKRPRAAASLAFAAVVIGMMAGATHAEETWQTDWEKTLVAARKEGTVLVSGPPGAFQRQAITSAWAKAFPDITLEYTGGRGTQVVAKIVRERSAALYNWDIIIASTSPTVFSLVPIDALAPLRDALIMPDIQDDKTWVDSFEAGFMDRQKKFFYNAMGTGGQPFGFANRDCLSKSVFGTTADMAKPELKSKVVWYDPTEPGTGSRGTWVLSLALGEDWLKNIFQNQGVTFSRDYKQMTDWLVNCTKPIAIGMPNDVLEIMQKNGIGKNVEELSGATYLGDTVPGGAGGNESIGWFNNAPHPNAAKVFVNWYLSREFQQIYANAVKDNSRRLDTKPGDPNPAHQMKPGVTYINWSNEEATLKIKALQKKIKSWDVLAKRPTPAAAR